MCILFGRISMNVVFWFIIEILIELVELLNEIVLKCEILFGVKGRMVSSGKMIIIMIICFCLVFVCFVVKMIGGE